MGTSLAMIDATYGHLAVNALQNVAAFLRQGYYLPGGLHYDEVARVHGLNAD